MTETTRDANCKFFLLRYVPDAVKNEFVNIGLVLLPPAGRPELRFSKDWSRVQALDPHADTELLEAFREEISRETDMELVLRKVEDSFSNGLQASESRACLAASPTQEADELARMYLETPPRRMVRQSSARQVIVRNMQREFQREGVWNLMRKEIAASEYTHPGDPLKIDCGYGVKSLVKMFHAAPLKSDVNLAKVLAFSYPKMAAGIKKKERTKAELTAIVEDGLEKHDEVAFALETLERYGIQVATISELPGLAVTAARELGIS